MREATEGRGSRKGGARFGFGLGTPLALGLLVLGPAWALMKASAAMRWPLGWVFGAWATLAVVNFFLMGADKHRATSGAWRIPEATLHAFELAGGWPGSFLGQQVFRHKTAKGSYRVAFWLIVLVHQVVAWDLATGGRLFGRLLASVRGG